MFKLLIYDKKLRDRRAIELTFLFFMVLFLHKAITTVKTTNLKEILFYEGYFFNLDIFLFEIFLLWTAHSIWELKPNPVISLLFIVTR